MNKKEKYNCYKCKDTGIIKYKDIEYLMYSWIPWKIKKCECKKRC